MSTNLSMYRGDTRVVQLTISGLGASGLTGFSFWFTAKNDFADADADAVIKKTTNDFTVVTVGDANTSGVITVKILPADTASLPDYNTNLHYDVQLEDGSGNVTTVATGTLTVKVDVTKASS
jgi:hypothetical protein